MHARVLSASLIAVGVLASPQLAQQGTTSSERLPVELVPGAVVQLPPYHYDATTGTGSFVASPTQIGGGTQKALVTCYSNSNFSGSFATVPLNNEWVDWGDKACGTTLFVEGFQIGYGTRANDPSIGGPGASVTISLYQGTSGGGSAFLGTNIATFALTGLPGTTTPGSAAAFSLNVTITSGAIPVGDGDIGWGYVGVDNVTGPLLVLTSGVCFTTPDPVTGTEDCFDRFTAPASVGPYLGTSTFTTAGRASFWLTLSEHDGSSTTSMVVNGTGVNPLLYTEVAPPILSQPWATTIDTTSFPGAVATAIAFCDDPFGPVMIGAGELLVDVSSPSLLFIDVALGSHVNMAPMDLSLIGNPIHTQGSIFDPSSGGLVLVNGIDFTLGL